MELKETDHSYYSSDSNYYVGGNENHGAYDAETWTQFKEDWFWGEDSSIDHDYNHVFRFDIVQHRDFETDKVIPGKFSLYLFFILQRKGIYRPVQIKNITQEDMPEINKYLEECWAYMQNQWKEFSNN